MTSSRTSASGWATHWADLGRCRHVHPDALFVQGSAQNDAARICDSCPVITECCADALDNRIEYGVWGGMTERQRRAVLRRFPHVRSWSHFFKEGGSLPGVPRGDTADRAGHVQ